MMSTAFARTAEITDREITEVEKQVIPDFMIAFVDEINMTLKQGLDPNANQKFRLVRGEWFALKMLVYQSLKPTGSSNEQFQQKIPTIRQVHVH